MQAQNQKRVLITGAAGFLGSHLCERFLRANYYVVGMDNFLTGSPDNIAHFLDNSNFRFIQYDVTNFIYIEEHIDLILHFACPASPIDYQRHSIHTMKVDSLGTLNTLGLARNKRARYVLASTSEIYGDPEVHPQPETYWGNVNTLGPRAVYDEAKRFSEALAMAYYRTHGIDVRMTRIFNTYGPRMRLNDGRVVPSFLTQALQKRPITVFGDGQQTRSFCFISDLVEGIFKLATQEKLSGEVFNLGNPGEYTVKELAQAILKLLDVDVEILFTALPPDDPKRRKPDISKAQKILHWQPSVSLQDGLRQTIPYFSAKVAQS